MTAYSVTLSHCEQFLHSLGAENLPRKKISAMASENRACFAKIIRSQLRGLANLPYGLGLDRAVYLEVLQAVDIEPLTMMDERWQNRLSLAQKQRSEVINSLIALRMAERNSLVELLIQHADDSHPYAAQAAVVVATACLSPAHLWKTLGLDSREELKMWLSHNFPTLTAMNTENMRWKRFFYLQLCQGEGDYVCMAPTCNECTSYDECFVTE